MGELPELGRASKNRKRVAFPVCTQSGHCHNHRGVRDRRILRRCFLHSWTKRKKEITVRECPQVLEVIGGKLPALSEKNLERTPFSKSSKRKERAPRAQAAGPLGAESNTCKGGGASLKADNIDFAGRLREGADKKNPPVGVVASLAVTVLRSRKGERSR